MGDVRERPASGQRQDQKQAILQAAAELLTRVGPAGMSTRAVASAAGVQTPALYRLFGDKDELLDAVASYGFESYLIEKRALESSGDAIEDMRRGWDIHVAFGLANPAFYALMYGNARPGRLPSAVQENRHILRQILERAREQGRLKVPVATAAEAIEASTTGAVLLLLSRPETERDLGPLVRLRDTVLASVLTDGSAMPEEGTHVADQAAALLASLGDHPAGDPAVAAGLRPTEAALLREWLHALSQNALHGVGSSSKS